MREGAESRDSGYDPLGLVPDHEAQAVLASLDRLAAMLTRLGGFGR